VHGCVDAAVEQPLARSRSEQHGADRDCRGREPQRQQQQSRQHQPNREYVKDRERRARRKAMREETGERHADNPRDTERRRAIERGRCEIETELVMQECRCPDDDAADRTVGEEEHQT